MPKRQFVKSLLPGGSRYDCTNSFGFNTQKQRQSHLINCCAYFLLRHRANAGKGQVTGKCESYSVPSKGHGSGYADGWSDEDRKDARGFLEGTLGLPAALANEVLLRGNPKSWWDTKNRTGIDWYNNFMIDVCNLNIKPATGKSSNIHRQRVAKRNREQMEAEDMSDAMGAQNM